MWQVQVEAPLLYLLLPPINHGRQGSVLHVGTQEVTTECGFQSCRDVCNATCPPRDRGGCRALTRQHVFSYSGLGGRGQGGICRKTRPNGVWEESALLIVNLLASHEAFHALLSPPHLFSAYIIIYLRNFFQDLNY